MKIEIEKDDLEELEMRATTYGLLLSALVKKHGKFNKHVGEYEYFVDLGMLQSISEANLFTTNEVHPVSKIPHTKIHVKLKGANGSA